MPQPAPPARDSPARAGRGVRRPEAAAARHRGALDVLGRYGALAMVVIALVLVALVRVRLAGVPLERDEGEYAYAGQLILEGIPPYRLIYSMKFPGAYYSYAAIMAVFGQTAMGIRLGLIVVNAATSLLVFAIGRRLFGRFAGAIAAVSFAMLSLDLWIMGIFAHATHFVLLPALAGLYLLLRMPTIRRVLWLLGGGALLGLAVLVKQHAFTFLPLGALIVWGNRRDSPRGGRAILIDLGCLAAGALVPGAALLVVFQAQGVLGSLWLWTFQYARAYVSEVPLSAFLPNLAQGFLKVTRETAPLWIAGGVGLVTLWFGRWGRAEKWFTTALLVASFVAVCPGLYFREHYFILLLPSVAILVGVAFASVVQWMPRAMSATASRGLAASVFLALILVLVVRQDDFLFRMSPREVSRARYGRNPFIESVAIADYIRQRTAPGDSIAVLGSEPEIYFYADRRSATGYIYMYPLMEPQPFAAGMQEELIRQVETAHPKYLVLVQVATSWLPRTTSIRRIVDWASLYTTRCYDLVGITDIVSLADTREVWDERVAGYQPQSNNLIFVFRRKSNSPCAASP